MMDILIIRPANNSCITVSGCFSGILPFFWVELVPIRFLGPCLYVSLLALSFLIEMRVIIQLLEIFDLLLLCETLSAWLCNGSSFGFHVHNLIVHRLVVLFLDSFFPVFFQI